MEKSEVFQESGDKEAEVHLIGASFASHPASSPDQWCDYHDDYSYCPSSGSDTTMYDRAVGVPCLVPSAMIENSQEEGSACKEVHASFCSDGCPEMNPAIYQYHPSPCSCHSFHEAYVSPIPCQPTLNVDLWEQHKAAQCIPQNQISSVENGIQESEKEPANFRKMHLSEGCTQVLQDDFHESDGWCVGGTNYGKGYPYTRRIRDPNILPVVDLTKSEMELFTLQDFKSKKLDFMQRKTEREKSTALVVCIDHGMCAAFYLPKDSLHDEDNDNGENDSTPEPIPPRRYISVKKSLDKVFPSSVSKPEDTGNQENELRFLNITEPSVEYCNYSTFNAEVSEEEEAVRNIPQSTFTSESE